MNELFPQASLAELCEEAHEIIAKAKERFRPVATFALFSGGNDSTAMLHLVKQHVDAAVHIVTGIGIPETLDFARLVCRDWGLPLIEKHTPPKTYLNIVLGNDGFPGPGSHSICYARLKSHRLQDLQRKYSKWGGENVLLVSGVRSLESKRRKINIDNKDIVAPTKFLINRKGEKYRNSLWRCAWANPIRTFSSRNLVDYREQNGIPMSPVAAVLHMSGECLCGCMAHEGELSEIEFWFPETGAYIRSLEREAERLGKPYCRWGWGHDKRAGVPAPGPLCAGCALFDAIKD